MKNRRKRFRMAEHSLEAPVQKNARYKSQPFGILLRYTASPLTAVRYTIWVYNVSVRLLEVRGKDSW